MNYPEGLVVDGLGNLYIGDSGNQRVRRVDSATGIITTFAGTGAYASSGNGGPATAAELRSPGPLALGADGQLCIGVQDAVRCIDAGSGIIDRMAGTEVAGFAGDGGPARDAKLAGVTGLAFDADDNLLISDLLNARIRRVDASTGIIDTIAGSGLVGFAGDGGPPLLARLHNAYGIAIHPDGRAVLADLSNQRVRAFDPTADGVITTVAGTGLPGDAGSDGPATSVDLTSPDGVMLGDGGDLYFVDTGSHRVMRLDAATGLLSTVAGRGTPGLSGDGGLARDAELNRPRGLARDAVLQVPTAM